MSTVLYRMEQRIERVARTPNYFVGEEKEDKRGKGVRKGDKKR